MQYTIQRSQNAPPFTGVWTDPAWAPAHELQLTHFHEKSGKHRPLTRAKLLYDDAHLHVIFQVEDEYVRSVELMRQGPVCRDSCVEFFVQPFGHGGYFNFEINAGGILHVTYIRDCSRRNGGFADYTIINHHLLDLVDIISSMPQVVDPPTTEPTTWTLQYRVPWHFFETFIGKIGDLDGQVWRGNFYKCGDHTHYPHWASWAPINEELNFHQPRFYAPIHFRADGAS